MAKRCNIIILIVAVVVTTMKREESKESGLNFMKTSIRINFYDDLLVPFKYYILENTRMEYDLAFGLLNTMMKKCNNTIDN
jgi:hypothetical protein